MGFTLAALALYSSDIRVTVIILLIPIVDTTFVTFSRLRRGVSPFKRGKDHISHVLNRRGFSQRQVALMFYSAGLLLLFLAGGIDQI